MKKLFSKTFASSACILLGILLIVHSCKKSETIVTDAERLEQAKVWFSVQKNIIYKPNWEKTVSFKEKGISYLIMPSNFELQTGKNKVISRLVIADSLGKYTAKLIEFVNASLPENMQDIASIYQNGKQLKKLNSNYTGSVLVLDAVHKYQYGHQFKNGEIENLIMVKFSQNEKDGLKNKLLMIVQGPPEVPIEPLCTEWYWTTWNGSTGEVVDERYLYRTCTGGALYGGGSGSSGEGEIKDKDITIDSNARDCIKNISAIIESESGKMVSCIGDMLRMSNILSSVAIGKLYANNNYNIVISERIINDKQILDNMGEIVGIERKNGITDSNNGNIVLNSLTLNEGTDLAVASTMIHEMMHSYFVYGINNSKGSEKAIFQDMNSYLFNSDGSANPNQPTAQHTQMATTYVNSMASLLQIYAVRKGILLSPDNSISLLDYCKDIFWRNLATSQSSIKAPNKERAIRNGDREYKNSSNSSNKKGC